MPFDPKDINTLLPDSKQGEEKAEPLVYQVNSFKPAKPQQKDIQLIADKTTSGEKCSGGCGWERVTINDKPATDDKSAGDPQLSVGGVITNGFVGGAASYLTSAVGGLVIRKYVQRSAGRDVLEMYKHLATWPQMTVGRGEHATLDEHGYPLAGQPIRIESIFDSVDPVTGQRFPKLTPLEFARALPTLDHRLFNRYNDPDWARINPQTGAPMPEYRGRYNDYTEEYRRYWNTSPVHPANPPRPRLRPRNLMNHLTEVASDWRARKQLLDSRGRDLGVEANAVHALEIEFQHAYPWFQYRAQHSPPDARYPDFTPYRTRQSWRYGLASALRRQGDYWAYANADDLIGRYVHYADSSDRVPYQKWLGTKRFILGAASALTPTVLANLDPITRVAATVGLAGSWLTYIGIKNGHDANASGESIRPLVRARVWRTGALLAGAGLIAATGGEEVHRLMSGTQSMLPSWFPYQSTETQSIAIGIGVGFPVRRNFIWRVPTIAGWYLAGWGASKLGLKEPLHGLLKWPWQSSSKQNDGQNKKPDEENK